MAITDKASADAAYLSALAYESDASGALAQLFLSAVRYYLMFDAQKYNVGDREFTRRDLQDQEKAALAFVKASPAGNAARTSMFTRGNTTGLGT